MKRIVLAAALAASFGFAHAEVLTFEGGGMQTAIPDGYGGLNWSNFYTADALDPYENLSGYHNSAVSGSMIAYNSYAQPASISAANGRGFSLADGYFTAAWNDGLQVTATATFEDHGTATKTFTANTSGPVDEVFGWTNLASVTFSSAGGIAHPGFDGAGAHFALDNLNVSAVPEPTSTALLLAGLAAVGLRARRRRAA